MMSDIIITSIPFLLSLIVGQYSVLAQYSIELCANAIDGKPCHIVCTTPPGTTQMEWDFGFIAITVRLASCTDIKSNEPAYAFNCSSTGESYWVDFTANRTRDQKMWYCGNGRLDTSATVMLNIDVEPKVGILTSSTLVQRVEGMFNCTTDATIPVVSDAYVNVIGSSRAVQATKVADTSVGDLTIVNFTASTDMPSDGTSVQVECIVTFKGVNITIASENFPLNAVDYNDVNHHVHKRARITTTPKPVTCIACEDLACFTSPIITTCNRTEPYCMATITDYHTGNRDIIKRCASLSQCSSSYAKTSAQQRCRGIDHQVSGYDMTCSFCCKGNNCNVGPSLTPTGGVPFTGKALIG